MMVNGTQRMSLTDLWRLIFKFTFDKPNCSYKTQNIINEELMKWADLIAFQKEILTRKLGKDFAGYAPVGKKGSILDEIEYQVGTMCVWVREEEQGKFTHKVATYRRAKIDYRLAEPMCKVFPECAKLRDFKAGREALKKAMKDNPEDYK